ncbi:MAG: thioredoxin [Patescibacteria group bacterium]|nr:thioredoxin [Patescibacteria group bacterium]
MVVILNDENFEEEVLDAEGLVLVDFWAPWCGPCQIMSPVVEELGEECGDQLKVGKLNVDENPQAAEAYGIMSIPTLLFFEDGEQVDQLVGVHSRSNIKALIDELVK